MYSNDNASSLLPSVNSLCKERPARPFFAVLAALTATLTVALAALAPAPAAAQTSATVSASKTFFLVTPESQDLLGATLYDIYANAETFAPPASAYFEFFGDDFLPQDRNVLSFAGNNLGYAEETSAVGDPFQIPFWVQGANVSHYALAVAAEPGIGAGGAATQTYLEGVPVSLVENGSGDWVPETFGLSVQNSAFLASQKVQAKDIAYAYTYNSVSYEYLVDNYSASIGSVDLYSNYTETVGDALLTFDPDNGVFLTAGSGGSAYYGFGSDESWLLNPLNGYFGITDSFFVATGDFAALPWNISFNNGVGTAYLDGADWASLFDFIVTPDVVGDPNSSAALFITNYNVSEAVAIHVVPEPSVVVTGLLFGLVTVGGIVRGRARRS